MKILIFVLIFGMRVDVTDKSPLAKQYMSQYKEVAISEMHRSGIPASIKLAQGMLESNWGRSDLANKANNHFGIKCGSHWSGGEFYKEDDDKNKDGLLIPSCFRRFTNAVESYRAHSDFLTDQKKVYRYGFLFELDPTDYKGWAHGLKNAGYATDPKYPEKLITIIEQHDLAQYDVQTNKLENYSTKPTATPDSKESRTTTVTNTDNKNITKSHTYRKKTVASKYVSKLTYDISLTNDVRMIHALGGETVEQLSNKVGVSVDDILSYNEQYIQKEEVLKEGAKIYIERKKRKIKEGPAQHLVKKGETMQSIAQYYGIRLKSLYARNRMPQNSSIIVGETVSLKETISVNDGPRYIIIKTHSEEALLFEDDPTVK